MSHMMNALIVQAALSQPARDAFGGSTEKMKELGRSQANAEFILELSRRGSAALARNLRDRGSVRSDRSWRKEAASSRLLWGDPALGCAGACDRKVHRWTVRLRMM